MYGGDVVALGEVVGEKAPECRVIVSQTDCDARGLGTPQPATSVLVGAQRRGEVDRRRDGGLGEATAGGDYGVDVVF